ncbi:hypothetical protein C8R43DRAFT_910264 [Mycena crocata]|nr:hypothetical protein C8R43DRAFT_910264 [Mycena crocata]
MAPLYHSLTLLTALVLSARAAPGVQTRQDDPCAVIGGQKWVAPKDVRACFSSFKVDPVVKSNILAVLSKTMAFHTSVNYQISAPGQFSTLVHEDLYQDFARIGETEYASDYDLHIDVSRTMKRLNDGHAVWANACYVRNTLFLNFLPIPLALLTEDDGSQNVYIVPEAFEVASAEFPDQISLWQDALPEGLQGQLQSLSGAKVLLINGKPPFDAVNANALITGSFQALGTRQNTFFSSYTHTADGFGYSMGNFAQQALPLADSVDLVIQRVNQTETDTITLPYRSRINPATLPFNSSVTYRANNCVAISTTNGVDLRTGNSAPSSSAFQQAPPPESPEMLNVIMDTAPLTDVVLPPSLEPDLPLVPGSFGIGSFYMLKDNVTGVLSLGSFSGPTLVNMERGTLNGLRALKDAGATRLIVDVTNNGGGYICLAHWLHRVIVGPKSTTVPQAGLDTKVRAGPLTPKIVQTIVDNNLDPTGGFLLFNPRMWRDANNNPLPVSENWLASPVKADINGHADAFSQRLGQECQPSGFRATPPDVPLFNGSQVVIVSNGRCASSCALFSITMAKEEGARTVFVGGNKDVKQQYCGTVGGQSTNFATIDTEIKTTDQKNNSLAPPDLLINAVQGITFRLAFGVDNTEEPEEWQDHPVDLNLPLTRELVNNPVAIWEAVTSKLFT